MLCYGYLLRQQADRLPNYINNYLTVLAMDFKGFIPAVLAILGISSFSEKDGRKVLTKEEKEQLSVNFSEQFIKDFEDALNAPEANDKNSRASDRRVAALSAVLEQTAAQLAAVTKERDALKSKVDSGSSDAADKEKRIAELTQRVAVLSEMAEPDNGKPAAKSSAGEQAFNLADDKQLGGMPGLMFSLERPYNQRARAALAARKGLNFMVAEASAMDFSALKEDLGAFYRTPWRDRLQSFIYKLPSLESVFPLESGYQDLATLVNIWLGDFSQAQNTVASNFDNVVKGSYEFGTETLRMFSVMFVHKFSDLAVLEKTWIGGLNREGSDPLKLSFIEFILVETAKKLHNEREQRRVNGVRKNPNPNVPGRSLEAADGLYEFVRKKIEGHIDPTPDGGTSGKTVYQIKPFKLPRITPGNIGEVVFLGTSMIPSHIRDTGDLEIYMPSHLLPLYHKYNEANYGTNQDYKPGLMCVKEFPGVKIVPIPNADNHCRLIWSIAGNIKLYEQKPGEMLNFQIEPVDWTLKVWSVWKESVWAEAVGYKYTNPAEMDGSRQLIWANDYDYPDDYFIETAPDANPSVVLHGSVITAANSKTFTITDIEGAKVGKVVAIKCGADGENGVTIKKAGKFALISADWTPAKGDIIRVIKRADGSFIEVDRSSAPASAFVFPVNETSPSVAGATVFVIGANTEDTAIEALEDANIGVVYTIHGAGSEFASTIANGGAFVLAEDMTLKEGASIQLVKAKDGKFYELDRVKA